MTKPLSRLLIAIVSVSFALPVQAATEFPGQLAQSEPAKNEPTNEVKVELPEEAPVVKPELEPTPPEKRPELLGSASEGALVKPPESPATPVVLKETKEERDRDEAVQTKAKPTKEATDKLRDVLAYVYDHNPQLQAEREKVKAVDESVSQAVSGFRPDIIGDFSAGRERVGRPRSTDNTTSKGLTLNQPLFSGGETVANIKAAKERVAAARADLVAVEQQVFFNTLVAYTGVVEAQSVLLLNQNNVDVLSKQREAASIRFEVGELTRTDVSQAEARLAQAKADEQQALGDLAIARAAYIRAVGVPPDENIGMPEVPGNLPKDVNEASKQARDASPVLEAARQREKAFASDIDSNFAGILPDVSLQAGMRRNTGSTFNTDSDGIVLNLSIPLYQGGAEWSRVRAARNVAAQAKFNTIDTTLAVEQDVTSAWQNFVTTESVIVSTEAAAKANALALEGVRQENEFGVRTVLDVLDAEQEYMNTKVNLVRAIRNHKIQAYRLLASVGKLTASELALPVKIYDPKVNYDNVKYQLLGL